MNNAALVNMHYSKREVIGRNWKKWVHPAYGKMVFRNMLMLPSVSYTHLFLYDISHFACGRICDRADRNRSNEKPDEDCTYEAGCSRLYELSLIHISGTCIGFCRA